MTTHLMGIRKSHFRECDVYSCSVHFVLTFQVHLLALLFFKQIFLLLFLTYGNLCQQCMRNLYATYTVDKRNSQRKAGVRKKAKRQICLNLEFQQKSLCFILSYELLPFRYFILLGCCFPVIIFYSRAGLYPVHVSFLQQLLFTIHSVFQTTEHCLYIALRYHL